MAITFQRKYIDPLLFGKENKNIHGTIGFWKVSFLKPENMVTLMFDDAKIRGDKLISCPTNSNMNPTENVGNKTPPKRKG